MIGGPLGGERPYGHPANGKAGGFGIVKQTANGVAAVIEVFSEFG
jgi:hypothetical protein